MLRTRTIVASFLSLFFGILALEPCVEGNSHAALTPEQLIILVNDRDPDSVRLGRFYARRRGIPPSHIIALDLPYRESMSRTEYEEDLVQPLRKALVKKNLSGQTRAIATIYGVPLKIQAPYSTNQEKRWAQDALEWQQATMTFVRSLRAQLTDLLEAKSHKNSSNEPQREKGGPANHSDLNQLVQSTGNALTSAQIQIANLADSPALSEKKDRLSKIGRQLLGLRANLQAQEKSSLLKTQERSRALLSREIRASNQLLTLLLQDPSDKNRNLAYQLAQRYLGLFGVLSLTIDEINRFTLKDADASVDSELSLLWYEPGEYRLSERSPNTLYAWQPAKHSKDQDPATSDFPPVDG